MLGILADRTYRHLFLAQLVALVGTGLLTVALGLLAFELAGNDAGQVLGIALAIKMVAYIMIAPVVGAFSPLLPRRTFLVALDVVRAGVALFLPFVTEVWQIYGLIFVLHSASAAFTPSFQASIPEILLLIAICSRSRLRFAHVQIVLTGSISEIIERNATVRHVQGF